MILCSNPLLIIAFGLETRCVILVNLFPDQSTSNMLKGVVGLVTGGASGLGRATVERIVREGGKVTGT